MKGRIFLFHFILLSGFFSTAEIIIEYEMIVHRQNPLLDKKFFYSDGLILTFNDKKARIDKLGSGLLQQYELYTYQKNHYYQCVSGFGDKKYYRHSRNFLEIKHISDSTYQVLGVTCKKATGERESKKIEVFYTESFGIEFHPNLHIDGIALRYTIDDPYFGKITYQAISITVEEIPNSFFDKKGYVIDYPKKERSTKRMVGKLAPTPTVFSLNGKKQKFKTEPGKITVVNFWFKSCQPCLREIPFLNELVNMYASQNVYFVALALDEPKIIKDFLEQRPFLYTHLTRGKNAAEAYQVSAYPSHFIIDAKGVISFESSGYKPDTIVSIAEELDKLLQE